MAFVTVHVFSLFLLSAAAVATVTGVAGDPACKPAPPAFGVPLFPLDRDLLQFALNLEHTECDFFLYGALGRGLDSVAPELAMGGPPPIGARKADLDETTRLIIEEFGYQEVGHLRFVTPDSL